MEGMTYCKPLIIALLGRSVAYAVASLTPPPSELPVRSIIWRARHEGNEVIGGFKDWGVQPPIRLTAILSADSCRLQKIDTLNPKPVATILRGAEIRILDCSRHGFRKALVEIQLSDGSIRKFRLGNTELEVVSKCLELVPASWRSDGAAE